MLSGLQIAAATGLSVKVGVVCCVMLCFGICHYRNAAMCSIFGLQVLVSKLPHFIQDALNSCTRRDQSELEVLLEDLIEEGAASRRCAKLATHRDCSRECERTSCEVHQGPGCFCPGSTARGVSGLSFVL